MNSLTQWIGGRTLAETLTEAQQQVRQNPASADPRAALVQLMCLNGDWERARTQLKSWLALAPQAAPTVTLLDQCIAGEISRAGVFAGQEQPRLPGEEFHWVSQLHQGLQAQIAGDRQTAEALRAAALDAAPLTTATLYLQGLAEPVHVAWLSDGDGRFGPVCETLVNGHYYWLPFAAIAEIEFQAPASVTDLVWRHSRIQLVDGSEQVCQIPVRYPFDSQTSDAERRGQMTEWQTEDEQLWTGRGQKSWLDAEQDFPLLTLSKVVFSTGDVADA
ncbi:type VI secretion system accessory protein TagJ [Candidatus Pantoea multigeneris]|uniref:Protein of avirulence locus ImpE n=1 Tax=Candidatus Pantoea multigeneris TaxID=2608357 RepID=A0ABX0R748_9GAMM|nr:type VI secretion system accessory protein TagJ [Pantoea multigeneris]NIF20218.1 protein of avirulence locus ImpE [Pantoea multigeneris]